MREGETGFGGLNHEFNASRFSRSAMSAYFLRRKCLTKAFVICPVPHVERKVILDVQRNTLS